MNPENKKILTESYPGWFQENKIECGDGWFTLLIDLCEALVGVVPADFKITQVKEKFAGLRLHYEPYDDHITRVINLVEKASFNICEKCGKGGTKKQYLKGTMWLKSLCDECHGKFEKGQSFYDD